MSNNHAGDLFRKQLTAADCWLNCGLHSKDASGGVSQITKELDVVTKDSEG
jgi:hypothetical protein